MRKPFKHRMISGLMALIMTASTLSASVFAAETDFNAEESNTASTVLDDFQDTISAAETEHETEKSSVVADAQDIISAAEADRIESNVDAQDTISVSLLQDTLSEKDRSICISISRLPETGILRVIQMDAGEEYESGKLNNYASLNFSLVSKLSEGENALSLNDEIQAGKQVLVVLRDSSGDSSVDYCSDSVIVCGGGQDGGSPDSVLENCSVQLLKEGSFLTSDTSAQVKVKLDSSIEQCYLTLFAYAGNAAFDPDATYNQRLWSGFVKNGGEKDCPFSKSYLPLKPGYKITACLNVPVGKDNYRRVVSQTIEVAGEDKKDEEELVESSLKIATSTLRVGDSSVWVIANFDQTRSGTLSLYSYSGNAFALDSQDKVLLYSGTAAPSENSKKVSFITGALPLVEGQKIVAVLQLTGDSPQTLISDPLTIKPALVAVDPTVTINEREITEGDNKMKVSVTYDKNAANSVQYIAYLYEGEALNKDAATTKILSSSNLYSNTNFEVNFNSRYCPLKAGAHIVVVLSVTNNGGVTKEYFSNVMTVDKAPNWGTPTAAFEESAVKSSSTAIPVTITYHENYLSMDDYYCNVSIYKFSARYSDQDFDEQELHENLNIATRIGDINSTVDKIVRGQVEVPVKSTATLTEGDRLIIKLRLPHTEWEGEEVDYFSASVPIVSENATIPDPKILLYNLGTDSSRGSRLRAIAQTLGIEAITVEHSQINQTVGYLARLDGFESAEEAFTGGGYDTEFMLMCNLGEALLDRFLLAMQAQGLRIDHKAVVTEYNRYWTLQELIGDIGEEHDVFQALLELDQLIKSAEKLKEEDYDSSEWVSFVKERNAANEVLASYEPALETLQNAISSLKAHYLLLTGQQVLKGKLLIHCEKEETDAYVLKAEIVDGSENASYRYEWSNGATENKVTGISADQLAAMTVKATAQGYFGELLAKLKVPDAVFGTKAHAGDRSITLTWPKSNHADNMPKTESYMAELYRGNNTKIPVQTQSVSADETKMTWTGLENGTVYTIKFYAVNPVGASDRMTLKAIPQAQTGGKDTNDKGSNTSQSSSGGSSYGRILNTATSGGSFASRSKNVTENGTVSAAAIVKDAVKAAQISKGGSAVVRTQNAVSITPDALRQLAQAGADSKKTVTLHADTIWKGAVQGRLYVDTAALSGAAQAVGLGVYTDPAKTAPVSRRFNRYYENTMRVVALEQQGSFGVALEIAAKLDLTGLNTESLVFYSYDVKTNTYTRLENTSYWVEANGYLHFRTVLAGSILVTDHALTRK